MTTRNPVVELTPLELTRLRPHAPILAINRFHPNDKISGLLSAVHSGGLTDDAIVTILVPRTTTSPATRKICAATQYEFWAPRPTQAHMYRPLRVIGGAILWFALLFAGSFIGQLIVTLLWP
jgi:hypothetical protein